MPRRLPGHIPSAWALNQSDPSDELSTCSAGLAGFLALLWCPECAQCMPKTAQVIAETAGWLHARTAMLQISWLERSMEGADAAPRFLQRLLEATLQSFYDCFRGLSELTKG